MNIERIGDYFVDTEEPNGFSIGIETENIQQCIREAKNKNAVAVFGSPTFGFKQSDLYFLNELPQIERIWFWDINLDDVSAIYNLKNLKKFGIHPKRPEINFGCFNKLEELVWEYNKKDTGIILLKELRLFHIWHYNPKSHSYEGIQIPESVQELKIYWANPTSLVGMPILPNLKHLEIHRCRSLKSIDDLPHIAPNLEKLVITTSKNVNDAKQVMKELHKLEFSYIQDSVFVNNNALL